MPSFYDIPFTGNGEVANLAVEDVDKFQKYPYYLVMNEVRKFPMYKTWDALFGSKKWTPNMGSIMRGVRAEHSPIGNSHVFPANITTVPTKHVFETGESTEEARLKVQQFESKQFNFLPSFQDFRDNQVKFNHEDIIRQIAIFSEQFTRTQIFYRSPNIIVAGNNGNDSNIGSDELVRGCPVAEPTSSTIPANGKTAAFLQAAAGNVGQALTLKVLFKACNIIDDDIGGLPFEGTLNTPRDNELIKGKYVCVMGTEAWRQFTFDDSVADLKSIQLDQLFDGFKGSLFGMLTCKPERFPLRMKADGTFVVPQIVEEETKKVRPNPDYTNPDVAQYEWAFMVAADAWQTITVGPPPKEFSSKSMSAQKFYSMRWNGEVTMTDQVLIKDANGELHLNRYGKQLQLISEVVLGALPGEINNVVPILFRRRRISTT